MVSFSRMQNDSGLNALVSSSYHDSWDTRKSGDISTRESDGEEPLGKAAAASRTV